MEIVDNCRGFWHGAVCTLVKNDDKAELILAVILVTTFAILNLMQREPSMLLSSLVMMIVGYFFGKNSEKN